MTDRPLWRASDQRVLEVASVALRLEPGRWAFADRHAADIDAHWARRRQECPHFFNGAVHLLADYEIAPGGRLVARFVRSDFKSFLYWREHGWPDSRVMDAFGSALIVSRGGGLLLGRQRSGHLNGGLTYPPGGFIDARDLGPDGTIDLDGSVMREIREEVGLSPEQLQRRPGYIVTCAGPVCSIGVPYVARCPDAELRAVAERHLAADPDPELADVLLLAPGPVPNSLAMPAYARVLIAGLADLESFRRDPLLPLDTRPE